MEAWLWTIDNTCDERRCSMRAMSKAKSCAEVGAANSHLSFSKTSISMDCSSGTEMEQSVKTTRLSRDIGRGSWSLDANKRQAEASSCNWVLLMGRQARTLSRY